MIQNKSLLIVQAFIFSLYLSWWFGFALPGTIQVGLTEYWHAGLIGFLLFATASITSYLKFQPKKWISIVGLLGLLLCTILLMLPVSEDIYIKISLMSLIAVFQGFVASLNIKKWYQPADKINLLYVLLFGISFLPIPNFIEQEYFNSKREIAFSPVFYMIVLFIFLLMIIELFSKNKSSDLPIEKQSNQPKQKGKYMVVYLLAMIFIALEILFIYWSLVLSNDNQGIITSLTFPLTMLLMFVWRLIVGKVLHKISDLGWLFILSIVMTVSIGLFYTFSFTLPFILGFSFSMALLIFIHNRIFSFAWDKSRVSKVLMGCAIAVLVCGFYIQNHIDFIKSINMPEAVLVLSSRQAIIKELASFAGIAVIISGYLFLRRRTLFN